MAQTTQPSAAVTATDRATLADDVVRRVTHIAAAMRHLGQVSLARLGLTPAAARVLDELDPDHPAPARDLAEAIGCDRSNITALVDRLEQSGFVERHVDPADRRLRIIVVTEAGRRVRDEMRRTSPGSQLLAGLTDDELAALRELVWKISDGGCPEAYETD